ERNNDGSFSTLGLRGTTQFALGSSMQLTLQGGVERVWHSIKYEEVYLAGHPAAAGGLGGIHRRSPAT
ncbi:hypothetical protein PPH41_09855, partial [Burkholderia gladioli]|nr:hypothetical protein [Burkholderia gladioli]